MIDLFTEQEKAALNQKRKRSTVLGNKTITLATAATFTSEPIAEYIKWWTRHFSLTVEVEFAGYNQVFQELLDRSSFLSTNRGINLLLIRFEDWIRDSSAGDNDACRKLEINFEKLIKILEHKDKKVPYLLGVFPVSTHLSLSPYVVRRLEQMTRDWQKVLEKQNNVHVVDFTSLDRLYNIPEVFDPITDREGHLPFTNAFYAAMGAFIARKIVVLNRPPFKVIALDCDNTLWQGVCGEDGPLGVRVQGPWQELQRFMLQKYHEGMLLTLCSKNNQADVWEVFEKNPHMMLKKEHLVAWRINWNPKSGNLQEFARGLNVGLDSFIFVDDSPSECSEVMTHCPEVLTLRLPREVEQIPLFLQHTWAFDNVKVTEEDRSRALMYRQERERKDAEAKSPSLTDFLSGLGLKVSMNPVSLTQVPRVAQLTQRTNQFNLSTIRRTEEELTALSRQEDTMCWVVEVSDRFGDYGLVGVVIFIRQKETLFIDTFLLSCRVLGRGVEDAILAGLKTYCVHHRLKVLEAHFYLTAKNQPIRQFLEKTWELHRVGDTFSSYVLPVEKIAASLEYMDFYYRREFEKIVPPAGEPAAAAEAGQWTAPVNYGDRAGGPDGEQRWEVYTVNRESMVHRQHFLPLEHNTARDLLALPTAGIDAGEESSLLAPPYAAPRDETESKLAEIWQQILKVPSIGIDASFFQSGGNSIKATMMASQIYREFGINITLARVFQTPRIRGLAQYIKETKPGQYKAVEPAEKRTYYPLSPTQQRFYILQQMDSDGTVYNIPMALALEGVPDRGKMQQAFKTLIHRHESLRTSIQLVEGAPVQRIHDEVEFEIEYDDLAAKVPAGHHYSAKEREKEKIHHSSFIIHHFVRAFDLSKAPLLRIGLIRLEERKYILAFDMHHIISDGSSLNIFAAEYMSIYRGEELPPLPIQFKDFCQWQDQRLTSGLLKQQEEYWLERLAGELPVLNMHTDFPRPSIQDFSGAGIHFSVGEDLIRRIKEVMTATGTTLFMVLLTVYNILLCKYSGQEDIIVGTTTAGRDHSDLEHIIGLLIETLALRNYPHMNKTFTGFLQEVKTCTLEAFENQAYPFREIIKKVADERDLSHNPLFDTMLMVQNIEMGELVIEGLKFSPFNFETGTSRLDLTMEVGEMNADIWGTIDFCTRLFKKETMERFSGHFLNLLRGVVENPSARLWEIDMMAGAERLQVLEEFNRPAADYPNDKTICDLFVEQVSRTPDNVALIGTGGQGRGGAAPFLKNHPAGTNPQKTFVYLTYLELANKSGQLAHLLREKGVEVDTIVAIMVEPSVEMMIGLLGILKAGGTFLPIAPDCPQERIDYMLKDSGAKMLINKFEIRNPKFETNPNDQKINVQNKNFGDLMVLDFENLDFEVVSDFEFRASNLIPSNLAYLIYTSGSTGKPKGVAISHKNIIPLFLWFGDYFRLDEGTRVLQTLSYSFDFGVFELFTTIIFGGAFYFKDRMAPLGIEEFVDFVNRYGINTLHTTPTLLKHTLSLGQMLPRMRMIHFGGEALTGILVRDTAKLVPGDCMIYNGYGPTEATINSAIFSIKAGETLEFTKNTPVPIGKPSANNIIHILDNHGMLQPIGVPGELCIAGEGLSRGYLNNPELTAKKFILPLATRGSFEKPPLDPTKLLFNQFSALTTHYSPIYRTGDLACWLPNGNIEFLGRVDHQIKIRGFRIEPGEIEKRLLKHEKIKEAIVVADDDHTGDKYLCAYIVFTKMGGETPTPTTADLKEYLSRILPGYMLPAYFIPIERIPLSPNGKLNRSALPRRDMGIMENHRRYTPPRNRTEQKLVEIWTQVLGREGLPEGGRIGIEADFFELGGYSIKAALLVSKIHKELNVKIPMVEVFKIPTIAGLSRYIKSSGTDTYAPIEAVEKKEYYNLSHAQKRLWIQEQLEKDPVAYNMPGAYVFEKLNREAFVSALETLTRRHEILRTTFVKVAGEPKQKVHDFVTLGFKVDYIDLRAEGNRDDTVKTLSRQETGAAFDLEKGPLLRVKLLHLEDRRYTCLFTMHHIISDGWSMMALIDDVLKLYNAYAQGMVNPLEPLRIHYKDFTYWHNRQLNEENLHRHKEYWLDRLSGPLPVLALKTDFPRRSVKTFKGQSFPFQLDAILYDDLSSISKRNGVSLLMTIAASLKTLFYRYTGQEDIIIGLTSSGREHMDLRDQIGFFVNALALRTRFKGAESFKNLLDKVKQTVTGALEHQVYPFDLLVEELGLERDMSRSPLFDVLVQILNFEGVTVVMDELPQTEDMAVEAYDVDIQASKFDLVFNFYQSKNDLTGNIIYNTDLFRTERVVMMFEKLKLLFGQIITNPDIALDYMDIDLDIEKKMKQDNDAPFFNFG